MPTGDSRRTATIAMLVAVEVLILGFILYLVAGRGMHLWHMQGGGHGTFVAKSIPPMALGSTPVVTIDDPNSNIVVSASSDGLLHVVDRTQVGSAFWNLGGSIPQLHLTRTADGVTITRAAYNLTIFGLGSDDQEVDVALPAQARVNITESAGATLSDLRGTVSAQSGDGDITAKRIHASNVNLGSTDGDITLSDVATPVLTLSTTDGDIAATGLAFTGDAPQATIGTTDGSVRLAGSFGSHGSYTISSADGGVHLAFANPTNLTVNASTADGSITVNGNDASDGGSLPQGSLRIGDGSGTLHISTTDGSIHLTTNGVSYHG